MDIKRDFQQIGINTEQYADRRQKFAVELRTKKRQEKHNKTRNIPSIDPEDLTYQQEYISRIIPEFSLDSPIENNIEKWIEYITLNQTDQNLLQYIFVFMSYKLDELNLNSEKINFAKRLIKVINVVNFEDKTVKYFMHFIARMSNLQFDAETISIILDILFNILSSSLAFDILEDMFWALANFCVNDQETAIKVAESNPVLNWLSQLQIDGNCDVEFGNTLSLFFLQVCDVAEKYNFSIYTTKLYLTLWNQLVQIFYETDPNIPCHVLEAILSLSYGGAEQCRTIYECQIMNFIFGCLGLDRPKFVTLSIDICGNLVYADNAITAGLLDLGLGEKMLSLLSKGNSHYKKSVLMISHNILVGGPGLWIRIVNDLILPNRELFLPTIVDSNFATRNEAINLFQQLIKQTTADMAQEFVSAGLVQYCAQLLRMVQQQSGDQIMPVIGILYFLLVPREVWLEEHYYFKEFETTGALQELQQLTQHKNPTISEQASEIIDRFLTQINIIMEYYITAALNPDINIRKPAEEYLFSVESSPQFIPNLLYLYRQSENSTAKLPALMYARSIITKNWVNIDEQLKISEADKELVRPLLLELYTSAQSQQEMEYLRLSIAIVAKYDFPLKWPALQDFLLHTWSNFVQTGTTSVEGAHILHSITSEQIKKRTAASKKNFKNFTNKILGDVYTCWKFCQEKEFLKVCDKILLNLLWAWPDFSILQQILDKLAVGVQQNENIFGLIKGFIGLQAQNPMIFSHDLNRFLNILCEIVPSQQQQHVIEKTCELLQFSLNTWQYKQGDMEGSDVCQSSFTQFLSERIGELSKLEWLFREVLCKMSTQNKWESWSLGDTEGYFQECDDYHDDNFIELIKVILENEPDIIHNHIPSLFTNLTIEILPGIMALSGLIVNIWEDLSAPLPINIGTIVQSLEQISVTLPEFTKKIVLKETAWIVGKWLKVTDNPQQLIEYIWKILQSSNDIVVMYECCLTIKQYIYRTTDRELLVSILNEICPVIYNLLKVTRVPHVIWHLVYFVNSLIEKSAYFRSNQLLQAISTSNIQEIMLIQDQVVLTALAEMLQGLVCIYNDELFVTQLAVQFLMLQQNKQDYLTLWHSMIIHLEPRPDLQAEICRLEAFIPTIHYDQCGVLKIIEETYLYYAACRIDLQSFCQQYIQPVLTFQGDPDVISRQLSLVSVLETSIVSQFYGQAIFSLIPHPTAIALAAKIILFNPQIVAYVDVANWIRSIPNLSSSVQKKIVVTALLTILPTIDVSLVQQCESEIWGLIIPILRTYTEAEQAGNVQNLSGKKLPKGIYPPSQRKVNYVKEDDILKTNLFLLFKNAISKIPLENYILDPGTRFEVQKLLEADVKIRPSSS